MDGELTTLTLTIPNDATGYREEVAGRYVKIVSMTVASVLLQFDNGILRRVTPGDCYPGPKKGFKTIRIVSDLGGCTVVLHTSPEPISGSDTSTLAAMAVSLASINQEISGAAAAAVAGQLADTICPITPGPGVLLFAANPLRTEVEIFAPRTNGAGLVYLGIRGTRATVADKFGVLSAGEPWSSVREKGAIYACSSTGAEIVNGREC